MQEQDKNRIEEMEKRFDEKFQISIDFYQPKEVKDGYTMETFIAIENSQRQKRAIFTHEEIKKFWVTALLQESKRAREEVVEGKFKELKNYDFKEKHSCRFNDGEQDCQCFIDGLNVALQALKQE